MTPIENWLDLIRSDADKDKLIEGLKSIYQTYKPYCAGLIFTGHCPNKCQHCIYPPDYSVYNNDISADEWKKIVKNIYDDLDIRLFVSNGRSFNKTSLEVLTYIKKELPDTKVGIIDNGLDILPFIDELKVLQPDWIDISLDGMEVDHDRQRNQAGSFNKVVDTLSVLMDNDISPKINILTCLTTINYNSIIELIFLLNEKGFKNFFISPVSVLEGFRPSVDLKVSAEIFRKFVKKISKSLYSFGDIWIELNLFDADYFRYINKSYFNEFKFNYDHLVWDNISNNNLFFLRYFPNSLAGIREFVVNCTGEILPPKVMAKGKIVNEDVFGSLLINKTKFIIDNMANKKSYNIFIKSLFNEQQSLKGVDKYAIR
ncbi:Radical SAM domain-containing protein [Desulfonema limicola]|uniref:Radical SAM domain-containing protein n=1 Tax=Desulfonema limicola TaxID=45656 RepID=A0A975B4Q4_9BACT|nr:radical SAM protein [Desulfonema limicola]QTA78758.1 Radical SAM domain-containing protein [Desulfonema limicola]